LRKELATEGFAFEDGLIRKPVAPGLGVHIDDSALARFRAA
jgi:L-alanine-DL-glutamate epimerase-like enolase superfamily enzyme